MTAHRRQQVTATLEPYEWEGAHFVSIDAQQNTCLQQAQRERGSTGEHMVFITYRVVLNVD